MTRATKAEEIAAEKDEYVRSLLIVRLRCEIAFDAAKAFRAAATSGEIMTMDQRRMLHAVAAGYELQHKLMKSTLDLARKNDG